MSADNYYEVREIPHKGWWTACQGFASDECPTLYNGTEPLFRTLDAALDYAWCKGFECGVGPGPIVSKDEWAHAVSGYKLLPEGSDVYDGTPDWREK